MEAITSKSMFAAMSERYWIGCLLLAMAIMARADPPTTREAVEAVIRRSATDSSALLELKDAPLDLIMPYLRSLLFESADAARRLQECRQGGNEKEFIASEKEAGRDVERLSNRLPLVQNIMMSDPNFDWTVVSKVTRITYDLNERFKKTSYVPDIELVRELGFVSLIPGDVAIRIIGPSLEAPYFPVVDHGDAYIYSPASQAHEILARVMKERYGEVIPKDIEAARAWWKENEHRFAETPSPAGTPGTGNGAPQQNNSSAAANGKSASPRTASPATTQETNPTDEQSRTPLRWLTGTVLAATIAAAFVLISRARK